MDELFKNTEALKEAFSLDLVCGMLAGIFVLIIELILLNKIKKSNRRVDKAKALGHIVKAKRLEMWHDGQPGEAPSNVWYYAKYDYEVDGRKYRYRYMSRNVPPMINTLYYINNPRKAFTDEKKSFGFLYIFCMIIPLAVAVAVAVAMQKL